MRITIDENIKNEDEIIIKCSKVDDKILKLISMIESNNSNILVSNKDKIIKVDVNEVFYFESVDKKTFAYTSDEVYEISLRLYEIEDRYSRLDFFRASKSFIINIDKIDIIKPILGGRLEVILENNEKLIVSRQYVKTLKHMLNIRKE